mmetsp:Transcript_8735/g.18610  ORF Transcript_8735/g.18610 Transcript_8735/m.18610 type:complete len:342 (+) Transcript_8735:105-1130(+)|eukprot:CAMPEP_0202901340 /NCGR_PEP_ID=MMETSP1392-20130828/14198_1 /ASSEMBLY_ACC=CAM_ASM_000868 /TAXON_ID=225041 /ORGANISM="Chlamydomonas chlamydogama, Strain SAG 11-48b" /LENGTH=341 /DNA_ID=CAMNT_0049587889 /DNA_START=102 /DNA_END=1127 /DNA_ORIENTATION=+
MGKPNPKQTALFKNLAYVILGLVGLYFGYSIVNASSKKQITTAAATSCPAPPGSYNLVQIYKSNSKLSMFMFVFSSDDISKQVKAHSSAKADMADAGYHKFYANHLCNTTLTGQPDCKGIVLDVGAYLGTHALVLAKLGFDIHAFEPYPTTAQLLRCSASVNQLGNLRVVQEAISNTNDRECLLHPMASLQQLAMLLPKNLTVAGCSSESVVDVVTLDHYWKAVLKQEQILFIKIDAEGHEDHVLEGAKDLFATKPPRYILLEYYPKMLALKNVDTLAYFNRIYDAGYRVYDCQQQAEVPQGPEGLKLLAIYKTTNRVTDLLLVHKSFYTKKDLPDFACGY